MSAIHEWSESNGVGEVVTDGITNLNFGSNDSINIVPATYPITRADASFEKYIRAKFAGTFTEISNMLFWKSVGVYVADESCKAAANVAYVQPSETANGDSDIPVTEGTALVIQASDGTATILAPGYTKYIRSQLQTGVTTPAGAVNQKTLTFQYDEV